MAITKNVLLLRSEKLTDEDKFAKLLESKGFTVDHIPVMTFIYPNQKDLHDCLLEAGSYSGLIFTSPRAAHAISLLPDYEELLKNWKHKLVYVVGDATYKAVAQLGLSGIGQDSGCAANLAEIIIAGFSSNQPSKPLLFLSSSKKLNILPHKLQEKDIPYECLHIYESVKDESVENRLQSYLCKTHPIVILFFSPSCVEICSSSLQDLKSNTKLVALGASTRKMMEDKGLPVHTTLQKPQPQYLLEVLEALNGG